jgi:hypothetical protein
MLALAADATRTGTDVWTELIAMDKTKYFRRRQFALGPEWVDLDGWTRWKFDERLLLTVHPDLALTHVEQGSKSAALLGYMIDPFDPEREARAILEKFLEKVRSLEDVTQEAMRMSGRFVMLVALREDRWLFHDAVALRQVCYSQASNDAIWCASQAETIAERLGSAKDPEVVDFAKLPGFQKGTTEFWLLNDKTPYQGIRNLLPNHFLDLRTGRAARFWPRNGSIPALSITESIERCTPILQQTIEAASQRFDLRMGISAGNDSRKTLAASKKVKDRIYYFSHAPGADQGDVNDIRVPARLLPKLGIEHHRLGWSEMDDEFRRLYEASATLARTKKGHIAYTLLKHFGPETTVMNSNIAEVSQCIYWLPKSRIDGRNLAIINGLPHPWAIKELQAWIDGAKDACDASGMDILALFFLEQRMGRWCTMAFSEYDIAHETFNPFNNRLLHSLMLGVAERHRRDRRWDVSIKHIKYMWPETLSEPINPQDRLRNKVQQFIRRFIIHKTIAPWLPVYPWLRYLKKKRRFEEAMLRRQNLHATSVVSLPPTAC